MTNILRSFAHGLVESKLWLCTELEKHVQQCDNIYLFGGWTGVLGFMIYTRQKINFEKIVNIDIDKSAIDCSDKLLDVLFCSNKYSSELMDCSSVLVPNSVGNIIINTSVENMSSMAWFETIHSGALVVLQGRTYYENDGCELELTTLSQFKDLFPLTTILYQGTKYFDYAENPYARFMLIGFK